MSDMVFFEGGIGAFSCVPRGVSAMEELGGGVSERFFCVIEFFACMVCEGVNGVHIDIGKEEEASSHIVISTIAPELPIVPDGCFIGMEPYGALGGFSHFCALGGCQQGHGESVEGWQRGFFARQFDPCGDISPLVASSHLYVAGVLLCHDEEVIGLEDHVVKFEEAEMLFAFQP